MSEENREVYTSKNGFKKVKVIRGFTEIKPVFEVLKKHDGKAFILGGYVRFMCSPRNKPIKAGDLDIYCKDDATYDALKLEFDKDLEIQFDSDVAVSYGIPESGKFQYAPSIQLIKAINQGAIVANGTMEEILGAFDFSIIRTGLISEDEALVDADFEHDEQRTLLRIKNIHCPISSTLRCMKYAKKGYFLKPIEVLKLFVDWEDRDGDYRSKITDGLKKMSNGEELSDEDLNALYKLMKID